jgi:hypothetical protein
MTLIVSRDGVVVDDDNDNDNNIEGNNNNNNNNNNKDKGKDKGRIYHRTGHEGPEVEQMYTSTLPSASTLDGVGSQRHAPSTLPPGPTRYTL